MQASGDVSGTVAAWRWGEWLLLPEQRRLLHHGKPVALDERVFDLILLLIVNHARVLSLREITSALWGSRPVGDNTLRQVVYKTRRALGDDGKHQTMIRTLAGRGLQWVAPTEALREAPPPTNVDTGNRHKRPLLWWAGVAALVLLVAAGLWSRNARAPLQTAMTRIAIQPIENASGDEAMDWVSNGLPGLLSSLLDQSGGIDVIDPLQVARIGKFKPQQGRSQAQQLRFSTGANVIVGGQLRKLGEKMYALDLTVNQAQRLPASIELTGQKPGVLAADAVIRIRRALELDAVDAPAQSPRDNFVAEAYARGIDMAAHGHWTQAATHFKLCVENAPDFLPAYIKLGQAQTRSDQVDAGIQTLHLVLKLAAQRKDSDVAARAARHLGEVAQDRQHEVAALKFFQQAHGYFVKSHNARMQAASALDMVSTYSAQGLLDKARVHMSEASQLIADHNLRDLRPALFAAQRDLAYNAGDKDAEEAADRALLAENEAIGDQHNAVGSVLSLARVKMERADWIGALPLLRYAYTEAPDYHDTFMTVIAGDFLANALLALGVDEQVEPIIDHISTIANKQHYQFMVIDALRLRAAAAEFRGDFTEALRNYQQVHGLLDPKRKPTDVADVLLSLAFISYQTQPDTLAPLSAQLDALVQGQKDRAPYLLTQRLMHALAQSATHHSAAALDSLTQAADGKSGEALDNDVRRVAFVIGHESQGAAALATKNFQVASWKAATDLRDYSRLAASQGDQRGKKTAEDRILQLRKAALASLDTPVQLAP